MWAKLGPTCMDVLDTLCTMGDRNAPGGGKQHSWLVADIMDDTGRSRSSVFYALKRLKIKHLVGRKRSEAKRAKCGNVPYRWYATETGIALIDRAGADD